MTRKPNGHAARAADRMAADDRLVQVHLRLRAGSIDALDALAARHGQSRADVVRDAVGWLIARESAWLSRRAYNERMRALEDEKRALAVQLAYDPTADHERTP